MRSLIAGRAALVGNGVEINAGEILQQLAGEMRRRPGPGMGERQAARLGPRLRDHVAQRLERRVGTHQQDIGRRRQQRNRREVLEGVVGNFGIQKRIGGMAACDHNQRVAVRRRRHQRLRRHHATRARPVFDHHGLAPLPGDHIAQRTGEDVDPTAGGIRHENMHRFDGKYRLGGRGPGRDQHRHRCGRGPDPPHGISPDILYFFYRTPAGRQHRHRAQITGTIGHVDNP